MKNLDPPYGLMRRALGGFRKYNPAQRAGEKNSPALEIVKKILRLT